MLAPGNYVQWKSIIKRYIDTKPNNELIHYCLQNPPYKFKWIEKIVLVAEASSETTTEGYIENYKNVSQDIQDQLNVEAEAMWKAIERLKQGESINVQDLETNLYWEFGKFTSRDGESLESYYSRFVTLVKQSQELKTVSYHKLYDILKQHQNEVNEIRAERLARTANPLSLVAQQQPVYHPQNHPNHYTQNSLTRSQPAATRNKGKEIVKYPPPTYDQEPATVADDDEMSKQKEIDKLMALISLSFIPTTTSELHQTPNVGTQVVQKSGIQCYNCKEYGHVSRECQKPKRAKDAAYHKEKMLLCKQEEAGVQLNAEQVDWKDDTDDEPDDQELEAHYMYMAQIQEVTPDAVDNSRLIFDPEPLQKVQNDDDNYNVFENDREHPEQPESDNTDDLPKEHDLLASLIEKLKCEIDDSKNHNKFLESSNKALVDKLKDLKKFQAELERYYDVNYASKVEIDCAKAKGNLMSYKIESEKSFNEYTQKINDLNQTILDMKKELFAHQETISIMSQEKEA
ncbi:retrovirus-related pol polyprotein from transposon TNT 1-94 [Tanacetum coccineum]